LKVRLWGTRGSIPVPGVETAIYGGNTTCVEVRLNDGTLVIFDAGTGVRKLGLALKKENINFDINLIITHSHWDHIQGFPFFEPARLSNVKINVFGCSATPLELEEVFANQMRNKFFPLKFKELKANITFKKVEQPIQKIGHAQLTSIKANHPGSTFGYKITEAEQSFVFLTDNELLAPSSTRRILSTATTRKQFVDFCKQADLLIHDAMWTDEEIKSKIGWGHSSMSQVIELAKEAQVKTVVLFHHHPDRSDLELVSIFKEYLQNSDIDSSNITFLLAREGDEFFL